MSSFFTDFKQHIENINNPSFDKYRLAENSFWEYCKLINPKFFKESRPHLKEIANTLQALYDRKIAKEKEEDSWEICEGKVPKGYIICTRLMMNIPPRHGKTYTLSLFNQWCFGKNNENKVITVTYNETLSSRFSAIVRDGIDATKLDKRWEIFSDVFPTVKIKQGDGAKQLWSLEGSFFSYLGTSFGATITGIGCNIGIIDDPIKNAEEAYNENVLEKQWLWYTDTFLSRLEEDAIQILNFTRWSTKDLCGKLLDSEEASEWYELKMKAYDEETGDMLCPELLSFKTYSKRKKLTSAEIMEANYQQEPVDVQGKLYTTIKTYTELPRDDAGRLMYERIINYTDVADEGADFLCSINAIELDGEAYVINILYSEKPMEITEPQTAKMLYDDNVNIAYIESNNGGRGFARNVENNLRYTHGSRKTIIEPFYQSANKKSRILSNSTTVMNRVYLPHNWTIRFPEFYKAITTYKAKGKNKHDDAADAITGIAEKIGESSEIEFLM